MCQMESQLLYLTLQFSHEVYIPFYREEAEAQKLICSP